MISFFIFLVATMEFTVAENVNSIDKLPTYVSEQRNLKPRYNLRTNLNSENLQERLSINPSLAGYLHNGALDHALQSSNPEETLFKYISSMVSDNLQRNTYKSVIEGATRAAIEYRADGDYETILGPINDQFYQDLYRNIKYSVFSSTNANNFNHDIDNIIAKSASTNRYYSHEIQVVGEIAKGSYTYWARLGHTFDENRAVNGNQMACVVLADIAGAIFGAAVFPPAPVGAIWVGATFSLAAAVNC